MEDQLVTTETAILAKELGFSINTIYGIDSYNKLRAKIANGIDGSFISWDRHDHDLRIPSQSLLQRWIRKVHNLNISIDNFLTEDNEVDWDYEVSILGTRLDENDNYIPLFPFAVERSFTSYEQALEAALVVVLNYIKTKIDE